MGVGVRCSLWVGARALLLCGSAAFSASCPSTGLAHEAPNVSDEATGLGAFTSAKYQFEIPAGLLEDSLQLWAATTKLKMLAPANRVRHITVEALSGAFTPEQALAKLLVTTNLKYAMTGSQSVGVYDPARANARAQATSTTLPQITVRRQRRVAPAPPRPVQPSAPPPPRHGLSPVDGYVASESATATKTDTPIIEVPQSISVVTRRQMDDRGVVNLNDALRYTAGVQAGDTGDLTTESFSIRGYNSPYLAIYRDGLRAMFRAFDSVIEPYGLDRVEVLKGPASVLYGQGIPGGVVNLVTKRPPDNVVREIQLQGGSFDRRQAAIDIGGPLAADKNSLYRLTVLDRKSDTQIDFVPDDRVYLGSGLTLRTPLRDTTLTLLLDYQNDKTSFPDGLPALGTVLVNPNGKIPVRRFTGEPDWSSFKRSSVSIGSIFDHDFNDHFSIHQVTRYTSAEYDRNQIQNRGLGADLRTIDRRARQGSQSSDRVNTDTRGELKFDTGPVQHKVLAGADYGWASFKTKLSQGNIDGLDIFTPRYGTLVETPNPTFDDHERATQLGIYLQDQAKIWDRLILVAGVRRDWADDRYTDKLGGTVTEQKDQATTYRLGAIYQTPFGVAPYVSYTQSFVPVSGTDAQGSLFKPETGEQYEGGIKYQPPGQNFIVTLAAYHLVRQNVLTPDPADLNFSIQTGEVTTKGIEFEAVGNITKELSVIGTVTVNQTKVTKSTDVDLGKRPTTVPDRMASLWADYTFKRGVLSGLGVGAGVRYVGNTPGDMANTFFVPSSVLFDAALRYDFKNIRLAIRANNVFDETYVSTCFSLDSCYYGGRRSVIGTWTYKW